MNKHVQDADERANIARVRKRYYDARREGMSHVEAAAIANGDEAQLADLRRKADAGARSMAHQQQAKPIGRVRSTQKQEDERVPEPQQNDGGDPSSIDIPPDWKDMIWPSLRSLAHKFANGAKIKNRADAEKAINAEIKRRAKSAS